MVAGIRMTGPSRQITDVHISELLAEELPFSPLSTHHLLTLVNFKNEAKAQGRFRINYRYQKRRVDNAGSRVDGGAKAQTLGFLKI